MRFDEERSYSILSGLINPDHLYFALGELPFITGKYEKERYDPFAPPFDIVESVKDLSEKQETSTSTARMRS